MVRLAKAGKGPMVKLAKAGKGAKGAKAGKAGKAKAAGKAPRVRVVKHDRLAKELRRHRGRVVLVHFWATWCLPCLDELPMVDQFARDMKPRGLDVLSLSLDATDGKGQASVAKMLGEKAPGLSQLIMEVRSPEAFMNSVDKEWEGAIPAVFCFDRKGELRGRFVGEASRGQLEELTSYLLKPAPRARAKGEP